jgi:hypothetical protein
LRKKFNYGFGTVSLPWQDLTVTSRAAALSGVRLTEGHAPECNYKINDHQYTKRYYLVDDIYLKSSIFVKTIPSPYCEKKSWFSLCREGCKKDVKRAFAVRQAHFAIIRYSALTLLWLTDQMWEVMNSCVIMQNMIIENERAAPLIDDHPYDQLRSSCPC